MSLEPIGPRGLSKHGSIQIMGRRGGVKGAGPRTVAAQSLLCRHGPCGGLHKDVLDVERIQHFFCQQRLTQGY